jgi:hypothetical protein
MAEVQFGVAYEGPALAEGRMPVKDLAPSLLALGELFTEASEIACPDREPASLNIRATKEGSFVVDLAVHSPDTWEQILNLLDGHVIGALSNLMGVVIGAGTLASGLFWLIRKINGRRIADREQLESGLVRLTFEDGTTLEASPEALALYERESARKNARKVVEPLHSDGVERVVFTQDSEQPLVIGEDDLPAYEAEMGDEVLSEREYESVVTLAAFSAVW